MIQISALTFQYKNASHNALEDISLTVPDGGFLGVIGPAGAGKTTLAYALSGIVPHHYAGSFFGRVTVDGLDTVDAPLTDLSRLVGSVFQDVDSQMVTGVVEDELLYGLENFGVPHGEMEARIAAALQDVGMEAYRTRMISSLSGGQKQKVAIAAILALRPKILVLDEPTGELDPGSSRQIFELLKTLNETLGTTVVVIEQKIMLLCQYAQELAVLSDGRLTACGKVRDVLKDAAALEAAGVNCPRTVTLSALLQQSGVGDGRVCVTPEEAAGFIREVLA